ncbi:MAG TPA: TetR/AcrR family transcriptional regulator [Baekduia sp.]|nr:TetR/AcrR family transcriptional regulator [Baekduia sp.]
MSREEVQRNQRERILAATIEVASLNGYVNMSVEDIISTAGLSRRTFYDFYKGKEEAFLLAYEDVSRQLMEHVLGAVSLEGGFAERVRDALSAFLTFFAERPTYADVCIVEVLAAGPAAIERRNAVMSRLSGFVLQTVDELLPKRGRPPELAAETLIGGVYEVVYSRVLEGKAGELPELLPDLLYSLLLPYLGPEQASAEMRKQRRKSARRS